MKRTINGIQQIGIGVANAQEAFDWYRKIFGTDVVVFKDAATASLMKKCSSPVGLLAGTVKIVTPLDLYCP